MILHSLTPRSESEYRRYPFPGATIGCSNRRRLMRVSGFFCSFASFRLALPQSCNTTLHRMFMMTAAAASLWGSLAFWLTFALAAIVPLSAAAADPDPKSIEFFEKEVRPLLLQQCVSCHGQTQQFSSLRVDSREALLKGGN